MGDVDTEVLEPPPDQGVHRSCGKRLGLSRGTGEAVVGAATCDEMCPQPVQDQSTSGMLLKAADIAAERLGDREVRQRSPDDVW